ncbi:hypothetical protein VIGAN_08314800 [Vigna angularis var. angularis]|uniref:Uncharacterized protein n=1 Tax=Vigna angularis var. angularis TaxID=157739 RepID=A0A0S3STZ4_PHAAN|nr:hypothetical protein VIGAN_08314800 [Vigna angularis var. angularis]
MVPITSVSQKPFQHDGVKGHTPLGEHSSFFTSLLLSFFPSLSSSLSLFKPTLIETDSSSDSPTSKGKFNMALLPLILKAALS